MDPDEALRVMLDTAAKLIKAFDDSDDLAHFGRLVEAMALDVHHAAECAQALDGWVRKGGWLPTAWRPTA